MVECVRDQNWRDVGFGARTYVPPMEVNLSISPGGRVRSAALPLVRVRLIPPVPEFAPEVNARNIPAGRNVPGDVLQPSFEDWAVPIELER